jgi:hypothetical protein
MIELKPLQNQVKDLVVDLRAQVAADEGLRSSLRGEYDGAARAKRVGATFETWLDGVLDQAAVAWVLGCVFVRFCEDNELVEKLWIGGPLDVAPVERAVQNRQAFLIENPRLNDRDWLRRAFEYLAGLHATGALFDKHNPVWRFDISGEAAEALSDFFRRGQGLVSLRTEGLDTRFLGDLYQDLSEHARNTYALLQTPEFVEEFILDRTFEAAVREFGLSETSVIDPTCGSGHFLLGAFARLVRMWVEREPGTDIRVLVERALGQVTGVDINPFAVAIARFRLMVAALTACGLSSLERAPAFPLRIATGDSLLTWSWWQSREQGDLLALSEGEATFAYETEDADLLAEYLEPGRYAVVVGNPPYITVKDKGLNEKYRKIYLTCSGKYQMTVPFAERFFGLAKRGDHDGNGAGWVGQITANAFMKREFGKKLIDDFFAQQVGLAEVIDTSGAYIPGHGTPTVILVGRNCLVSPRYSGPIRMILGVRGEPGQPGVPAKGLVWSAILDQIDRPGSESEWITSTDIDRTQLAQHPWSLSGGGAADAMDVLRAASAKKLVSDLDGSIGFYAITGDDDVFVGSSHLVKRWSQVGAESRGYVTGDGVRDWTAHDDKIIWPYDGENPVSSLQRSWLFWPYRSGLRAGLAFGRTREERGMAWHEYTMLSWPRVRADLLISFACVATHNHFVLLARGPVANRHAPVIKLAAEASEDDHLRLLGVLNSSTACFWLKQVSQNKGNGGIGGGIGDEAWEPRYEFTGTKLEQFPLPERYPLQLARELEELAQQLSALTPAAVAASGVPSRERLADARGEYESTRARMIALQEELDWQTYQLYQLTDDLILAKEPPELKLGERAFEIVLARKMSAGEADTQWFARHGSTPITDLPAHWSEEYKSIVERRIQIIESDRDIGLIERPECKRRWATPGWNTMQQEALRDWLLDRLEGPELWAGAPTPLSVAQLADRLRHDDDFRNVLDLWAGTADHDLTKTLSKLVSDEHVPYLPAQRYKPSGLRKRAEWERTWTLQREEDNENVKLNIPVPPKYTSADFVKNSYWRARGKLDVPKERFISYPKAGRDTDGTELLGWAGWDHLAQAQALATVYLDRKNNEAWPAARLLPLLAGIAELEPWLRQWYSDQRPGFPGSPAAFFTGLIDTELAALSADRGTLRQLRGVEELT